MSDFGQVLISGLAYRIEQKNYNGGNSYCSSPVRGDGLVHRSNGLHTIQVSTTNFNGNVALFATLDAQLQNANWVQVPFVSTVDGGINEVLFFNTWPYNTPTEKAYMGTSNITNSFYTVTGQFAWIKAQVSNISWGAINSIKIAF